jgi:hypothetical protein
LTRSDHFSLILLYPEAGASHSVNWHVDGESFLFSTDFDPDYDPPVHIDQVLWPWFSV